MMTAGEALDRVKNLDSKADLAAEVLRAWYEGAKSGYDEAKRIFSSLEEKRDEK